MRVRVIVAYDEETRSFSAVCPELPGCASFGATEAEALERVREAVELYLEPTPQPLDAGAREVFVEAHVP